jgi:hypothetical protein
MRSDKQIQAARENGAKSRGPKTPEGKVHSSQNATKHGFLAKTLLLPNEDQSDFEAIAASYIAKFQPEGPVETHLVEELIACYWRQRRAWGMETSLLDNEMTRLKPKSPRNSSKSTNAVAPPRPGNPSPTPPIPSNSSTATKPVSTAATSAPSARSANSRPPANPLNLNPKSKTAKRTQAPPPPPRLNPPSMPSRFHPTNQM